MNAEYISYCCSRNEWETVRLLLALNVPIGLQDISMDAEACQAAYDSLCDQGILIPSGDSVIVDRLFSFLITQASQASACLALRAQGRHLLLHRTPALYLLSVWTREKCVLTPLPSLIAVREPLFEAAKRCSLPADLELLVGAEAVSTASVPSRDALFTALEDALQRLGIITINDKEAR